MCQVYNYELVSVWWQILVNVCVCVFSKHPEVFALFPVLMMKRSELVLNAWEGAWAPWRGGCAPRSPGPGVHSQPRVSALHRQRRPCRQPEAVAFLGVMTHFSSQRILGRVMRSQVSWPGPMTSLCREQGSRGVTRRCPRHCSGILPQDQWPR